MTTEGPAMYSSALLTSPTPTTVIEAVNQPPVSHSIAAQPSPQPPTQPSTTDAAIVAAAAATAAATAAVNQPDQKQLQVANAQTPTAIPIPSVQHPATTPAMQPMAAAAAAAAAFSQYPAGMMFAPADAAVMEDQPTYVNPKQYARILKRRESRKKQTGTDVTSYTPRKRSYMHESRHKHAMQRRRGPGGRFLSKEERNAAKEALSAGQ